MARKAAVVRSIGRSHVRECVDLVQHNFLDRRSLHSLTPAKLVPDVWIGQVVQLSLVTGRDAENLLGVTKTIGMLEAVLRYGYVLSVEDRVVFIPRESVVQMELFDTNQRTSTEGFDD